MCLGAYVARTGRPARHGAWHARTRLLVRAAPALVMDETWSWAQARAPRHALESDDEEDDGMGARSTPRVVDVTLRPAWTPSTAAAPPLVVLLGDVGAAVLAMHAPRADQFYAVASTVEVDGHAAAYVAPPPSAGDAAVVLVPRPEWLPTDACAPLAEALLGALAPSSVAVVHSYVPSTYIEEARAPAAEAPLRFLAQVPAGEHAPQPWSVAPHAAYAPWAVPNTVTGVAAALFAEALHRRVPALLLLAPDARHVPPPAGWTPQRLVVPYEVRHIDEREAHARLAHLAPALSPRWAREVCALLPPPSEGAAPSAQDTLHRVATQYLYAAQSHAHAGHIGDGGMYI